MSDSLLLVLDDIDHRGRTIEEGELSFRIRETEWQMIRQALATHAAESLLREQLNAERESAKYCASCGLLLPHHMSWCGNPEMVISALQARLVKAEAKLAEAEKRYQDKSYY